MHPEVEELIKKKGWKPSQAAVFEDIKRAFPDMSLNDAMNLVLQYYFPQKEIRKNGAIIEHRLTDVRTGKERVLTLEEMIKARSIVRKHKLGNRDYQDAAAVRYDEKVIEVIRGLEGKLEELSHEKDEIKTLVAQQVHTQPLQTSSEDAMPIQHVLTWEEEKQCLKEAVLRVMEINDKEGKLIFTRNTHWIAIYRFAVDLGLNYEIDDPKMPQDPSTLQCKEFDHLAKELQFDVNPPTRIPFTRNAIKDINKDSYKRYNAPFVWSLDGLKDTESGKILNSKGYKLYKELWVVYKTLEKAYDYRYYIAATAKP